MLELASRLGCAQCNRPNATAPGRRLSNALVATAPRRHRKRVGEIAERSWETLGGYFRGQLLVALVDAVFIGLGLWLLGVPLALPLAVLVFFGGLFPIVGAVLIRLHPLIVLLSITAGAVTLGVLGAFLAVPVAAVIARIVEYLRADDGDPPVPPEDREGTRSRPDRAE